MEEGESDEWWDGSENDEQPGVLTGTPNQVSSGEQGQSGPYVQPMMTVSYTHLRAHET